MLMMVNFISFHFISFHFIHSFLFFSLSLCVYCNIKGKKYR